MIFCTILCCLRHGHKNASLTHCQFLEVLDYLLHKQLNKARKCRIDSTASVCFIHCAASMKLSKFQGSTKKSQRFYVMSVNTILNHPICYRFIGKAKIRKFHNSFACICPFKDNNSQCSRECFHGIAAQKHSVPAPFGCTEGCFCGIF